MSSAIDEINHFELMLSIKYVQKMSILSKFLVRNEPVEKIPEMFKQKEFRYEKMIIVSSKPYSKYNSNFSNSKNIRYPD